MRTTDAVGGRGSSDGFPEFPETCQSLLKKYLTRDVWEQLKDRRTSAGVSLQDCNRSGLANVDSHIGLYAGDAESYTVFAPLFEPIIADCHPGFSGTTAQRPDLGTVSFHPANPDPDGKYIISTRVRMSRNIDGYRLRPASTMDEDLEIERRTRIAFENLRGDLAGSYRTMAELDKRHPSADDHVFTRDCRFQEAAGINRNWPIGRGVFANEARSFFCWVNEEDHLRFISIQQNADIGAIVARLRTAMGLINQHIKFQHANRYGYVSSCPTNLGTGLRSGFRIKLPLSGNSPEFREICALHYLTVRSPLGENAAFSGSLYDISNNRRLGLSDVDYLHDCLAGSQKLIELEKSYEAKRTGRRQTLRAGSI